MFWGETITTAAYWINRSPHSALEYNTWGEATTTAAYLINRSPHSTPEYRTLIEMWHERLADYSNLKAFGCLVFVHSIQDKLEPRALRCVFMGYPDRVKGYKLWCTE